MGEAPHRSLGQELPPRGPAPDTSRRPAVQGGFPWRVLAAEEEQDETVETLK